TAVEAVPGTGYHFVDWSDGSIVNPRTDENVTADVSVTANFLINTYTLTYTAGAGGSILGEASQTVEHGTSGTAVAAVANTDYHFVDWSDGSTENPRMDANVLADISVTANFSEDVTSLLALDGPVSSNSGDDVTTLEIGHTTGTGTNRLMLVGISWNCGTTDRTISSVTFTPNGGATVPLSLVITQLGYNSSNPRYSAIYSLINPPGGQNGTILITFSGTVSNGIVAGAANFMGVDQTTPLGTAIGNLSAEQGTVPTITLSGLNGDELVFDNIFQGASDETQTLTPGSEQTELWTGFAGNTRSSSSTEEALGNSVTMSWTAASSSWWAIAAVPIKPASTEQTYNLTMAASPTAGGTTSPTVGGPYSYPENTVVGISATAAQGYTFGSWSGDVENTGLASTTVTMDANKTVTATFTPIEYTLDVAIVGNGSVSKDPDQATYHYGDEVVLTAIADPENGFSAWSGDIISTNNPLTVTIEEDLNITANFQEIGTGDYVNSIIIPSDVTPNVNDQITAAIYINMTNMSSPNENLGSFTASLDWNTSVLSYVSCSSLASGFTGATNPSAGHLAFNGANASGATGNILMLTVTFNVIGSGVCDLDLGYTAMAAAGSFTNLLPFLTVTNGSVDVPEPTYYTLSLSITGNGTTDPAVGEHSYAEGSEVEISATPAIGYQFDGWSGALSGSENPATIIINSDASVTANFSLIPSYELTIAVGASGGGTTSPAEGTYSYEKNKVVSITAIPSAGYVFDSWTGDVANSGLASTTVTMDATKTVTANFVEAPPGSIIYLGDIGSVTENDEGTTLEIPVGSAGVNAGNTIIVGFASRGAQTYNEPIVTDSQGNTYHLASVAVTYSHGRSYIFYAHVDKALVDGNTITITTSSVPSRVAVASVFSGLAAIEPLDQAHGYPVLGDQETAQGNDISSGPTGITVQANELIIGMIGTEEATDAGVGTWLNEFVTGPQIKTSGASYEWRVSMGYKIVTSTGQFTAAKTVTNNPYWAASIATFKTTDVLSSDDYNIVLSRPTNSSINVNTLMDLNGEIYIEYGTSSGNYTGQTGSVAIASGTPVNRLISGLSSDTRYYYRLVFLEEGTGTWLPGEEYSFHTQRATDETFTFSITSDSHLGQTFSSNSPDRYEQATLNIASEMPDFHLDLGDAFIISTDLGVGTYQTGTQEQVNTVYEGQRPYFGNFSHSTPVFVVIGNHENEEGWNLDDTPFSRALASIKARKQYFPNPVPDGFYSGNSDLLSAIGGDQLREDYYAFEWGDALFVILDPFQYTLTKPYGTITGSGEDNDETTTGDQWDWTLGAQQYEWFRNTLENSSAKYKFVFSHHVVGGILTVSGAAGTPGYVRGGAEAASYFETGGQNANGTWGFTTERIDSRFGEDPIHQLMVENGVSTFFHGHDHQFVHEERDGVVYQLVPSPGMTGYGFDLYDASSYVKTENSVLGNLPNSGHLLVTVSSGKATVDYVRSSISGDGVTNGEVSYTYDILPTNQSEYELTMEVSPVGTGTTNPEEGTHIYAAGSVVDITATPGADYRFDHWEGACTGDATCQVTMNGNRTVTAVFVDNIAPEITCPVVNAIISTGEDDCEVTLAELGEATATDNLDTDVDIEADDAGPFGLGEHTVTWTATDDAGNTDECSVTFTVVDDVDPEVICKDITVNLIDGFASIDPEDVLNSVVDNCSGIADVDLSIDISSFTIADLDSPVLVTVTAEDEQGNISNCVAIVTVEQNEVEIVDLGYTDIYPYPSTDANLRAMPVTFVESGDIQSISIYHNGGSGSLLLGVYSDLSGKPDSRLGLTAMTGVSSVAGWQTVSLTGSVAVTSGQTVWLAWIFENNPGIRYITGTPGRASASGTWSGGMPGVFGTSNIKDYKYSIYCTYSTGVPEPSALSVSPESIVLGYNSGSGGSFDITSNTSWSISDDADWLDVVPETGSNSQTIVVTANTANTGTEPREATVTITGSGVSAKTVTVSQENEITTEEDLGYTDIYPYPSTDANLRAMPV
ncbi:MAG TPA: metallophosphoesterase, partial [Bacteroidales bacterium]|nr:metallophosphoesterase [Bacteroidales bacterium]